MNYSKLSAAEYNTLTIDEKILVNAVVNHNGRDYGSLSDAIRRQNILDDEATAKFDELIDTYLDLIEQKEESEE